MTQETINIVKQTAPLIKEKKEEITTTMYKIMFTKYPKVKEMFKDATPDQYKKLANAVYAYAANIDKLENLKSGIETMAIAHVKTNVKAEHYPIVGECLLEAVRKVLNPEQKVLDAWAKAYQFLADALIKKEQELYGKAS
jgi:nitric oxide dioxygenase